MIAIRGGMGLGDALYVQAVARHFVGKGETVEACCAWPDVFRPLEGKVVVSPFRRNRIDRLAHYSLRRAAKVTTQFEDCCIQAGIDIKRDPVDLRLDWMSVNVDLVQRLRAQGKPVIVVKMPSPPFDRTDGFGAEFLPDCQTIQRAIDMLHGVAFFVLIGKGNPVARLRGIDLDLVDVTSPCDVLDIGYAADAVLGQCSFIVPLAEALGKPGLLVWSRRGLDSRELVIRQLTPRKVLHRPDLLCCVIDDCDNSTLSGAVHALCDAIRSPLPV